MKDTLSIDGAGIDVWVGSGEMKIDAIRINKNRGWRGLAEIKCYERDATGAMNIIATDIFSFSADVWDEAMRGAIVVEKDNVYHVIHFNSERLPRGHQRSVLIKNFYSEVSEVNSFPRESWTLALGQNYNAILCHIKNRNNHTTSDWNCVGIRVTPSF